MRPVDLTTLVYLGLSLVLSCTYDRIDAPARDAGHDVSIDGSNNGDPALKVEPAWPDAIEWSDYLTGSLEEPQGGYCSPDELDDYYCFQAGAIRKVVLEHETSCGELEASDEEHWYDWDCHDESGEVVFTSNPRAEVGLTQLIDAATLGWRANRVTVMRGDQVVAVTESTAWWDAPILPLPAANDGVIELDRAGAVYVATGTVEGVVSVAAHGVSLLGVRNATLASAQHGSSSVLTTDERRAFVWIENLAIDADGHPAGVDLTLIYGVVRGLAVRRQEVVPVSTTADLRIDAYACHLGGLVSINAPGVGVELDGSGYIDTVQGVEAIDPGDDGVRISREDGVIFEVSVSGCAGTGLQLLNAARVTLSHVTVANCDGHGVDTANGRLIALSDVVVTNNGGSGVVLYGDDQILTVVISANNDGDGVLMAGRNALLMHATTTNNRGAGLHVPSGGSANEIVNVVSANNETGLWLDRGSAGSLVRNAWLSANATEDVLVEGGHNVFTGTLDLGGDGACAVEGAPSEPGLSANPCANADASTASLSFDNPLFTSDGALAGHQLESDPKNPAVLDGGLFAHAAITDWLSFSFRQRHWGRPPSGSAFPDDRARGRCDAKSACAIWDWRVTSHPSRIRDPIGLEGAALDAELQSATHVRKHVWAATGSDLCLESDHTVWVQTPEPECFTPYLDYAFEPIHDDSDNSICATDLCFLNWNRGAFPGAGFGQERYIPWEFPEDVLKRYVINVELEDGGVEEQYSFKLPNLDEIFLYYFVTNTD